MVAKRLREFLSECGDVDFGAPTATQAGLVRFVNPEHEEKSGTWKLCYRAGKEAVTAAREAANGWLAELGRSQD